MIGAIIGDIVGSHFEFDNTNDFNFGLFTEECAYTDDTICTIAVADAAMNGSSYGVSLHSWCRRYHEPMGGIAEAIWGVPEQMQSEAMSYLPDDMVAIVEQFHNRKQNLRK